LLVAAARYQFLEDLEQQQEGKGASERDHGGAARSQPVDQYQEYEKTQEQASSQVARVLEGP
jgi:hypothetical protein